MSRSPRQEITDSLTVGAYKLGSLLSKGVPTALSAVVGAAFSPVNPFQVGIAQQIVAADPATFAAKRSVSRANTVWTEFLPRLMRFG